MSDLQAGMDFRLPEYRREVFLRFYTWSLRYRSFPGGVHYVLPYLAQKLELDIEQRLWLAWLNANTQNPVTSLMLLQAAPRMQDHEKAIVFWQANYRVLGWDTDRRYHKARFADAVRGYADTMECGCSLPQWRYYRDRQGWQEWWDAASALPTMGRLSTWSYLEYLRILLGPATVPDADSLMLGDISGSRSHRNGLALVLGRDDLIVDKQLGRAGVTDEVYTPGALSLLHWGAGELYRQAQQRCEVGAANRLSLESALCTYKSWHKPNRRYPGCYNDMLYDRLITAENKLGKRCGIIWDARRALLPSRLRLEANPYDPGCVPVKQNWYRNTGEIINMTEDWKCFQNGFEKAVEAGEFGRRARPMI